MKLSLCNRSQSLSSWLFLRCLGLCWLCAFISLNIEWRGLFGSDGILPVQQQLVEQMQRSGFDAWFNNPTVFWLNASDGFVAIVAIAGTLASVLVLVGIVTGPALLAAWICYGSLVNVGSVFFAFQWDALLLESTLLAMFLVRWRWLDPPLVKAPYLYSRLVVYLLRWLLFRVMFCSGAVKLLSGCPLWWNGSALNYYYETQLLPNPIAWYAHQLPSWMQATSAVAGIVLELLLPFFIFAPRPIRLIGAAIMCLLQLVMAASGNHGFINYLTIVLCIPLLDDDFLQRWFPQALRARFLAEATPAFGRFKVAAARALAGVAVIISAVQFVQILGGSWMFPAIVLRAMSAARAYHVVGRYGLYPWVFPQRTELVVEGSNDLKSWEPYEFKYHIGDVRRAPPAVAPLQPRLDWRMRFAALENPDRSYWFHRFLRRLLLGSPAVLSLLERNPFPDHPPQYLRTNLYVYHFTNFTERQATTNWWKREFSKVYFEPVTLDEDDQLTFKNNSF